MVSTREGNGRRVAAVLFLLFAIGTVADARADDAAAKYRSRLAIYQTELDAYKRRQSLAAANASVALSEKLEEQHATQIQEQRQRQYRNALFISARAAAARLSAKLERLYGHRVTHVATVVHPPRRPEFTAVAPSPPNVVVETKPKIVAQLKAVPVRPASPIVPRAVPRAQDVALRRPTPRWYGWGKL